MKKTNPGAETRLPFERWAEIPPTIHRPAALRLEELTAPRRRETK